MRPRTGPPGRLLPAGLALLAFGLALLQRPGRAVADTKIDLHVDPAGFLADVASVWSESGGLGQVQSGQYSGYLWPMAPFFALGRELGVAPWLVHRLWLGLLLALAAWGTVRLLDDLLGRGRGVAHAAAGLLVLLNPYVVVFANRTSVTLLGYAALPWLLLCVHRGVRAPGGWRWPAAFALVLASTGGGVNAAVTGWLLLGPLLLLGYEAWAAGIGARPALAFAWRTALLSAAASLWWIVPVAAHARYGLNFLPFTESAGSIWDTTSLSESLRLMGYWIAYLGIGYAERLVPYFDSVGGYLFDPLPIVATFVLPGLALAGFALTRRWRYGPFFLFLTLLGVMVMAAGFPEGAPLRRAATFTYNHVEPVQFLRTTYKAGPLAALGLACLAGAAAGALWGRLPRPGPRAALAGGLVAVAAVAAWPLVSGRAIDEPIAYGDVPAAWTSAADGVDRDLPPASRALVLPGQVFPFYRWGGTQDPILPALSERPVAVRYVVPYSDLHAADLLFTVDGLVQGRRVLPGQLAPLLSLMGVRSVVAGTDDDRVRSGSIEPAAAAPLLARELGPAERRYGPWRSFAPGAGDLGEPVTLPQVRRHDLPEARPLVRVEPRRPALLVDGSASGLAALAALDGLPAAGAIRYAGDADAAELRRAAAAGAAVAITDTNRRQVFLSSRPRQNVGAVLAADDPISEDGAVLNPFAGRGADGQTVAVLAGARAIRAPFSPAFPQFPEHRPVAAFDGREDTFWVADRYLERERRWVEIDFGRPRDVGHVDVLPQVENRTRVEAVSVAGRRFELEPGWNRLELGLRGVRRLRVQIVGLGGPEERLRGSGALAEVRIPGVRVTERLRPPVLLERALAGADLQRADVSYLFTRVTGDDPYRRAPRLDPQRGFVPFGRNKENRLVAAPGDAEGELARTLAPPAARSWRAEGWASVDPAADDRLVDELAGTAGPVAFRSSGRYQGMAGRRASRAFDGDPETAWVAPSRGAWIEWRAERPASVSALRLTAPGEGVPAPTRVRLEADGTPSPVLPVKAGEVRLPQPARGRRFRLEVVEPARSPAGRRAPAPPPAGRRAPAVGIAELRVGGGGPSGAVTAAGGRFASPCGAAVVEVGGRRLPLRVAGSLAALDAGRPLRARSCGPPVALAAGRQALRTRSPLFRVDLLRLRSPAPRPVPAPDPFASRVTDLGDRRRGGWDGVRVEVAGPSWLVLGESYNQGWRASCDGESLGAPRVVDGFANGWHVDRGCRDVEFEFAPNRAATWSYAASGLACLAMLALLVLGRRRGRAPKAPPELAALAPPPDLPTGDPPRPWPVRAAAAAGLAAALAGGFLFALRAGVVIGPAVFVILWRGVGARPLALAAGALIGLAVPVLYLLLQPEDLGGFNSEYATDLIAAHWVAVAAVVLAALAGARALSTARGRSGARAAERAGEDRTPVRA